MHSKYSIEFSFLKKKFAILQTISRKVHTEGISEIEEILTYDHFNLTRMVTYAYDIIYAYLVLKRRNIFRSWNHF